MPVTLWEVITRFREGEKVDNKDFDMGIFRLTEELRVKYDIVFDPEQVVPDDDALADRLFAAGLEFYVRCGTLCVNTSRVARFTEDEILELLDSAPDHVVLGEGADAVTMLHLEVEGDVEPIVAGGIQTAIFSGEEAMFRIYEGCARDRCIDGVWGGVVNFIDGTHQVRAGDPTEIYAYRKNIELLRQATAAAGRPGMFVINKAPLSTATIAMCDPVKGR